MQAATDSMWEVLDDVWDSTGAMLAVTDTIQSGVTSTWAAASSV